MTTQDELEKRVAALRETLKNKNIPWFQDVFAKTDVSSDGGPMISAFVLVDPKRFAARPEDYTDENSAEAVADIVRDALSDSLEREWVTVSFRTRTEQRQIERELRHAA